MRRAGGLWPGIATFAALRRATLRAARGKRRVAAAARFLERLEPECLPLERALDGGTWRPSPANTFEIRDPKLRTITAVPFRDRVVHHALIGACEPVFERRMIAHSFACRRGKGLHAALRHVRRQVQRHSHALRMDVASFFDSLQHDVVLATVHHCIKDRRALALTETIVRGPSGCGLPIGSLTSQWLANLVLDRLDHVVVEELRPAGYARYMDDIVVFANDASALRDMRDRIADFLVSRLALRPKARATRLGPVGSGVPFLGFLVFPGTVRLRPDNLRRLAWRLRERRWLREAGILDDARYRRAVASVVAHIGHADTRQLRRRWFRDHRLEL